MISATVTIKNPTGISIKPAGVLSSEANKFASSIILMRDDKAVEANAKSVLSLLGAGFKVGNILDVTCNGADEEEALAAVSRLIEDGLGEM